MEFKTIKHKDTSINVNCEKMSEKNNEAVLGDLSQLP